MCIFNHFEVRNIDEITDKENDVFTKQSSTKSIQHTIKSAFNVDGGSKEREYYKCW